MSKLPKRLSAAFVLCLLLADGSAQPNAGSIMSLQTENQAAFRLARFELTRAGAAAVHWTIELHPDGSGTYSGASDAGSATSQPIHVTAAEVAKLLSVYAVVRRSSCETKLKHIANTGSKNISFQAEDGATSSCVFNFSDNEQLNAVSGMFQALAATLQSGERLAQKHRYDRLGLDAEIDLLIGEVKDGRAIDVANIAPVLQSIAGDERLMERVQRKAARLLQDAGVAADSPR